MPAPLNPRNTYIHPIGTPVKYVPTIDLPWMDGVVGTVTDTWLTQDEPGEEPYRVYSVALQGGGDAVWDGGCTHYDFAWRERPEFHAYATR